MRKVIAIGVPVLILALLYGCAAGGTREEAVAKTGPDYAYLERQAEILAEHLIRGPGLIQGEVEYRTISVFVMGLVWYREDAEYMYGGLAGKTPGLIYTFPLENIQRVAWEVFAAPDWQWNRDSGGQILYNEQEEQYESGLEFGFASGVGVESVRAQTSADGTRITVSAQLYSVMEPESEKRSGEVTFQVVEENGQTFLRFESARQTD